MEAFWLPSQGGGRIHCCRWRPEGTPVAIVQILHGIAEHKARYDHLARWLTARGLLVVAEDHMGHGETWQAGTPKGRFVGGWEAAVADCRRLQRHTRKQFPGTPYFLLGHSMGSFLARTMLYRDPKMGLAGVVLCGTAWMPEGLLASGAAVCDLVVRRQGPDQVDEGLRAMIFGGYNARIPDPRTPYDWISRDPAQVDAYVADPMCGFSETVSLDRDMLRGMLANQQQRNLEKMPKDLPVLFIAGEEDPVGRYGKGPARTLAAFAGAGMRDLSIRLYPQGRHEILGEPDRERCYLDLYTWLNSRMAPRQD